ncbi:MAG: hypothetical protein EA376_00370 [Phycisphaeraceae bacterium]|nr:MAG: hypothetical protein EA376_00370 [Phycisphaeraceae bacterium]
MLVMRSRPARVSLVLGGLLAVGGGASDGRAGDFASEVVEYAPAPGQFINNAQFNDPTKALGAPVGAGTIEGDLTKIVSLGGFGGSITLRFSETVWDDPRNPMGLDFIVFGNAFWLNGVPTQRSGEAAVIEIARDVNGDGAPGTWYVIPGSSMASPPMKAHRERMWTRGSGSSHAPAHPAWYPGETHYPGFPDDYTTATYELDAELIPSGPFAVIENPNGPSAQEEAHWGYGDLSPALRLGDLTGNNVVDAPGMDPADFYTVPDDPFLVGIMPGSGGGDAFDIAWAVDPATGAPANLDGFDFIRISTGLDALMGPGGVLGELSVEVGGVARVRRAGPSADLNGDGVVNAQDLGVLLGSWGVCPADALCAADINGDGVVNAQDLGELLGQWGAMR